LGYQEAIRVELFAAAQPHDNQMTQQQMDPEHFS